MAHPGFNSVVLCCLVTGLSAPSLLPAADELQQIRYADDSLSINVRNMVLGDLLDEIARQSHLSVVSLTALDEPVSGEFYGVPMDQALKSILRYRSYIIETLDPPPDAGPGVATVVNRKIWIFPQGGDRPVTGEVIKFTSYGDTFGVDTSEFDESVQQALRKATADESPDVTAEVGGNRAISALGRLNQALTDPNEQVREAAVFALGEMGGGAAIKLLNQALNDEVSAVREAAADRLEELQAR